MKKNQTQIILLGIAAGALVFLGFKATSAPRTQEIKPEGVGVIEFSQTEWDIGKVTMSEGINTKDVTFKNTSQFPIQITAMETSCMCTKVQIVHEDGKKSALKGMVGHGGGSAAMLETIKPSEEATLRVSFDPNAHGPSATGPITRDITITTNNPDEPIWTLMFTGTVVK